MALTLDEMKNHSTKLLYKLAQQTRYKLDNRLKRLEEAYAKNPADVSPQGLYKMREWQMRVNKNMTPSQIRRTLAQLQDLEEMKTGTVTGAKQHMKETIRAAAGLPKRGRLNKEQQKVYNDFRDYFQNKPSVLSDFWYAFELYQDKMQFAMLDSDRVLQEFKVQYEKGMRNGWTPQELEINISKFIDDYKKSRPNIMDAPYLDDL